MLECSWCGEEMGARPEQGRAVLVDDLCLDCAYLTWKKHQPLAIFIEILAFELGVLRGVE